MSQPKGDSGRPVLWRPIGCFEPAESPRNVTKDRKYLRTIVKYDVLAAHTRSLPAVLRRRGIRARHAAGVCAPGAVHQKSMLAISREFRSRFASLGRLHDSGRGRCFCSSRLHISLLEGRRESGRCHFQRGCRGSCGFLRERVKPPRRLFSFCNMDG